jgi:hypothetical protein
VGDTYSTYPHTYPHIQDLSSLNTVNEPWGDWEGVLFFSRARILKPFKEPSRFPGGQVQQPYLTCLPARQATQVCEIDSWALQAFTNSGSVISSVTFLSPKQLAGLADGVSPPLDGGGPRLIVVHSIFIQLKKFETAYMNDKLEVLECMKKE